MVLSRSSVRLRLVAAHARVEKIADDVEFLEAFDDEFRTCGTGGGLNLHIGETEPALHEIGAQVNVLDARVGQVHLTTEENPDAHVNAFLIETIAQRAIAKPKIRSVMMMAGPLKRAVMM